MKLALCSVSALLVLVMPRPLEAQRRQLFPLDTTVGLTLKGARAQSVAYQGRKAVRLTDLEADEGGMLAIIDGTDFTNGIIELDLVGTPRPGAPSEARGFVGVAFRIQDKAAKFEYIYLRPTNGRSDDQLRRNHSTQYASYPDYPWFRTRKENPGLYESYVDLQPGQWTKLRVVVDGLQAKLYLHGSDQPCLIVNDLKLGISHGQIGLWIGLGTEAYFSNLAVTAK